MSMMCFPGALSMWAKPCSGKDGYHGIAILPVLTETPALCCRCGTVTQVAVHNHIILSSFHHFCRTVKKIPVILRDEYLV